ncbi:MAG: exodeoxyribonuclease VII large subunit [bacterium]|nr:exodeoxyribonuclease VII large subunit [bacterium]
MSTRSPSPGSGARGQVREDLDVWSVSRLNLTIRDKLQGDRSLQGMWLEGEVFNVNYHTSGHVYFSMKDGQSAISCTFFRGANQKYKHIRLINGMQILAGGGVSVYAPRGNYQFNVTRVMLAGEGELRLKIEEVKRRLQSEGLFEAERKQLLPELPVTVGIATAPTGAAIRDVLRTIERRYPTMNVLLAPCTVQGDSAAASIIEAIEALNHPDFAVDVIIAGRGGGSFEDLLAFNEEGVVRAFANSVVPIISAVGHEIDHPLCDLAADVYAPTPTGAAELAVPIFENLAEQIEDCGLRLKVALRNRYRNEKARLERIFQSRVYTNPQSMLEDRLQRLDYLSRELRQATQNKLNGAGQRLQRFDALPMLYEKNLRKKANRFSLAEERLQNFSPLGTLKRGYSVVRNADKDVIRRAGDASKGDRLEILLGEGSLQVQVEEVNE